jgi:tripartite-type tricarboxylate transporter receptor subunit TctC
MKGVGKTANFPRLNSLHRGRGCDFAPAGLIVLTPLVLIVRKDPVNDFKELAAYFRENHGNMQLGSAGAGSGTHLGCVLLNAALGLSNFEAPGWFALFSPKGTPAPIIRRLNMALSDTLDTPLVRQRLEGLGMSIPPPDRRSPEYLARFVASEIDKWSGPIKAANITMD